MGIAGYFGKYLAEKAREAEDMLAMEVPGPVLSLSVDFNGILYKSLEPFTPSFQPGLSMENRYNLFFQRIGLFLEFLLKSTQPTQALIISVDGIAPAAKLMQQRNRRYRVYEQTDLMIDTTEFSPGTVLMDQIDQYIQGWIQTNRTRLPSRVLYSGHNVPGEGEHKIMDQYRAWVANPAEPMHGMQGSHVLWGEDMDLFCLVMMTGLPRCYIWRDFNSPNQEPSSQSNNPKGRGRNRVQYRFLVVEAVKQFILDKTGLNKSDVLLAIRDFNLITILLGNDFLPHPPSMENMFSAPDNLFKVYASLKLPLTNPSGIIWGNFGKYLEALGANESEYLNQEANQSPRYPSFLLSQTTTIEQMANPQYDPKGFQAVPKLVSRKIIDYSKFRSLWYQYSLIPGKQGNLSLPEIPGVPAIKLTLEHIAGMVKAYLKTIAWVYAYYSYGPNNVPQTLFYPYYFTPLFKDMAVILLSNMGKSDFLLSINPGNFDQWIPLPNVHMIIFPPNLAKLTNPVFAPLMSPGSQLAWMMPTKFIMETNGKYSEHTTFPLLPFPILEVVSNEVNKIIITLPPANQRLVLEWMTNRTTGWNIIQNSVGWTDPNPNIGGTVTVVFTNRKNLPQRVGRIGSPPRDGGQRSFGTDVRLPTRDGAGIDVRLPASFAMTSGGGSRFHTRNDGRTTTEGGSRRTGGNRDDYNPLIGSFQSDGIGKMSTGPGVITSESLVEKWRNQEPLM